MTPGPAFIEALFGMMSDPALVAGADGVILFANRAFEAQFSLDAASVTGRMLADICGLPGLDDLPNDEERALTVSLLAGSTRIENLSARIRCVAPGKGIEGYCVVFDRLLGGPVAGEATERRALRAIIEDFPHGIAIWDDKDRLFAANTRLKCRYGRVGISFEPGADRLTTLEAGIRAGLFGARYCGVETAVQSMLERRGADRASKQTQVRLEVLNSKQLLKITSFVSRRGWIFTIYEDVLDNPAGRPDVQQLGYYYNGILQYLPDFLVHIGGHGLIEFINDSFAEALGKAADDIIGQPGNQLLQHALGHPMQEFLDKASLQEPRFSYDQRWQMSGGEFVWLRWSVLALFADGKPAGIIATGRDITVEYRQQIDLRHQSEELEKKNRSLEQFAAVVSHDLKAPLRHVSVFADMIVDEIGKGNFEDATAYATQVCRSAQRMDRVIKRLLEYSQIAYKIAAFKPVDLADIVIQATQNLESEIEEARAEILLSKLPVMRGDPDLLRHLMENLIANAVKYRGKGVSPRVRIYSTETGSSVNIFVEDNGIGIDAKYADRIFTAFQRLHKDDKAYEGFGIGLALCRQIAESHQGKIELDISYKTGARFVVKLPHSLLYLERQ